MQAVLDTGEVIRGVGDVVFALERLGIPAPMIELVDSMLNEANRLERQALERTNSDIRSYESSLDGYSSAMDDILAIVREFKGCQRLNRDKVLDAFCEIEKLIENVK